MTSGKFITLEGIDGAGKSTHTLMIWVPACAGTNQVRHHGG